LNIKIFVLLTNLSDYLLNLIVVSIMYMINTFKKNIQIRNKTAITFFGFLFFVIGFSSYQTSQAQVVSTLATPPASLCNITRDLNFGMVSPDVKELQKYLNNNGSPLAQVGFGSKGQETNNFVNLTRNALIKFQQDNKIPATIGVFDLPTRDFLGCKKPAAFQFTRDLKFGMVSPDVKELQKYLNNNGFPLAQNGVGSKGKETTFFGSLTKEALIKYQNSKLHTIADSARLIAENGNLFVNTRNVINGKQQPGNGSILSYTLTYTADAGGTISGTASQTVNSGSDGSAVSAVPNIGYYFTSWSDVSTTTPRIDINVTANKNVTANFAYRGGSGGGSSPSVTTYTLTYTADVGGTISGTSSQTVNSGSDGSAVSAVPNTGYYFTSWSDGSTSNPRTDINISADKSITASFAYRRHSGSVRKYTLTYTADAGGTISGSASQTVNSGSDGSAVSAIPNIGYHFTTWSDTLATATRTDVNVISNISVTASFAIDTHTVNFDKNTGDTEANPTTRLVDYNATTTLPTAPTKTGYTFDSWNTAADGSGTTFTGSTTVTENITVYAKWTATSQTLTFESNGGSAVSAITQNFGTSISAPANPTKTGYTFAGWYNEVGLTTVHTFDTMGLSTTVYAKWTAIPFTCGNNVTFTYNGSSVTYGTVNNSTTGRCWLDRNLGATRVALSSTDSAAYGDLFQWGRPADGHQIRTSGTQSGPVATITPGTNTFIKISPDWSSIDSDGALRSAYLAKTDGTGICPAGFRLPTDTEINAERLSWSSNNSAGAFASPLKLTVAGDRGYVSGSLFNVGVGGLYRSSSIYGGTNSGYLFFTGGDAGAMVSTPRSSGLTVRCLKD